VKQALRSRPVTHEEITHVIFDPPQRHRIALVVRAMVAPVPVTISMLPCAMYGPSVRGVMISADKVIE